MKKSVKKHVTKAVISLCLVALLTMGGMISILSGAEQNLYVKEYSEPIETSVSMKVQELGTVSVHECVVYNGKEYAMLPAFEEPQQALLAFAQQADDLLGKIQEYSGLAAFSSDTVTMYYNEMLELSNESDCQSWCNEGNEDYRLFLQFYDIFENNKTNEQIQLLLSNARARIANNSQNQDEIMEQLYLLLPTDSADSFKLDANITISPEIAPLSIVKGFDTMKGIAYANRYATSPNTNSYYYFSHGDCANFTSQILENGGVGQVVTNSEATGWWHKVTNGKHTHSQAWSFADVFSRYMGVNFTSSDIRTFTSQVIAGDFIAVDYANDGKWDHVGFVTNASGYSPSLGYYNIKIAQHTSNYNDWLSGSASGWRTAMHDGGKCGRVRR